MQPALRISSTLDRSFKGSLTQPFIRSWIVLLKFQEILSKSVSFPNDAHETLSRTGAPSIVPSTPPPPLTLL